MDATRRSTPSSPIPIAGWGTPRRCPLRIGRISCAFWNPCEGVFARLAAPAHRFEEPSRGESRSRRLPLRGLRDAGTPSGPVGACSSPQGDDSRVTSSEGSSPGGGRRGRRGGRGGAGGDSARDRSPEARSRSRGLSLHGRCARAPGKVRAVLPLLSRSRFRSPPCRGSAKLRDPSMLVAGASLSRSTAAGITCSFRRTCSLRSTWEDSEPSLRRTGTEHPSFTGQGLGR